MLMKDFGEIIARIKCAPVPENWGIVEWQRCGKDAIIYRGAEYTFFSKGPRKGKKKWGKKRPEWECVITSFEIEQKELEFEKETGKCKRCGGDGQMWVGWKIGEGNKFKTCKRCLGSGKSQLNQPGM